MKTFSFVAACSQSGKTTLIEKIVPLLKARGFRVAVIKHASQGFAVDKPGKDSWRFRQAGADAVVLAGGGEMVIMKKIGPEPDLEELEQTIDADIILSEGFKRNSTNRIEVFRSGASGDRPLCIDDPSFLALVSDREFEVDIRQFDLNDAEGVCDFLVQRMKMLRAQHFKLRL